jgi:hypothetical protein
MNGVLISATASMLGQSFRQLTVSIRDDMQGIISATVTTLIYHGGFHVFPPAQIAA